MAPVSAKDGPCHGCGHQERLGRRRFLTLLATGASLALAGCTSRVHAVVRSRTTSGAQVANSTPLAPPAPILNDPHAGPPEVLGAIPPPRPGPPNLLTRGPTGTQQIALTVDDGDCADCVAKYVEFAQSSGIHITFNPNGVYTKLWTPTLVDMVRPMVAAKQVQFGNHTWDHADLRGLSAAAITDELERNDEWIQTTFGTTSRPYFRPPYGYYNQHVENVAASLGYTQILMWNGSFGDSTVISPQQLISLAEQYLTPGTIMLGHLNHPTILSLFDQIQGIISDRKLQPVTLDEMFGTSRATG